MHSSRVAWVVAVVCVVSSGVVYARAGSGVTPKVLVPRPQAARVAPRNPSPPPVAPAPLSPAVHASILARIRASKLLAAALEPASPFSIEINAPLTGQHFILAKGANVMFFGSGKSVYLPLASSYVYLSGIPKGAWMVDCSESSSVNGAETKPFSIEIDSGNLKAADSVVPLDKSHVVFAAQFNNAAAIHNSITITRGVAYTFYGCKFDPI